MTQPDLFSPGPSVLLRASPPPAPAASHGLDNQRPDPAPFQTHSRTSAAAARQISPAATLRLGVLKFIQQRGPLGATDEEIQAGLTMNPSTQRPRRVELCNLGLVSDSGTTRRTKSGRAAVVWVAR